MDHLPSPRNPYQPIRVPYFGGCVYDSQGFHNFAERKGWDVKKLVEWDRGGRSPAEAASFLQAWLYFGLLGETIGACGLEIRIADFLCDLEGNLYDSAVGEQFNEDVAKVQQGNTTVVFWSTFTRHGLGVKYINPTTYETKFYITTAKLSSYLEQWEEKEKSNTSNNKLINERKVKSCLSAAGQLMDHFTGEFYSYSYNDEWQHNHSSVLPFEVWFSVKILLQTLARRSVGIYDGYMKLYRFSNDTKVLRWRMSEQGWCPFRASRLAGSFDDLSVLYYVSLLGPPEPFEAHYRCTIDQCLANELNDDLYTQTHVTADCRCGGEGSNLVPDHGRLVSILESGGIPLISLGRCSENGTECPDLQLRVVEYQLGMRYVAISHPWSGGLGNPKGNALPKCQLASIRARALALEADYRSSTDPERQIYYWLNKDSVPSWCDAKRRAESSHKNVLLWMDTLCVPVTPESSRKAALKVIKKTFERANKVLVLDKELLRIPSNLPSLELLMRLDCSTWQHRLWTLQEAVSGKNVFVQFSDKAVQIFYLGGSWFVQEGLEELSREQVSLETHHSSSLMTRSGLHMVRFLLPWSLPQPEFDAVGKFHSIAAAVNRRSTSKPRDEAICLAYLLDLDAVPVIEAADEDKLKQVFRLQREVSAYILFLDGPRMQQDGFRWAPATFLASRNQTLIGRLARKRPAYVTDAGLSVKLSGLEITEPFLLHLETFMLNDGRDKWFVTIQTDAPEGLDLTEVTDASIILLEKNDFTADSILNSILLSDSVKNEGTITGRYVCRLQMKAAPSLQGAQQYLGSVEEAMLAEVGSVGARRISEQQWLIK
ncbi:MAG: hypothetical protein M1840_002645 [Geoglossum simile]|nr:MAG: hypothetical protein M1840_002645 [Geoglossum simile]